MSKLLQKRPSSPTGTGRSSFSSIRERDCDYYAQTFTSTKISSYTRTNGRVGQPSSRRSSIDDVAVTEDVCPESACSVASMSMSMSPSASLLSAAPESSSAWTDGMKRQDSLLALGAMHLQEPYENMDVADIDLETVDDKSLRQPLEMLPLEIFRSIVDHLILDIPPNGIDRRNVDLMSLLVTSRLVYAKTLEALYRRVTIPHSRIFQKFRAQIEADPVRGTWVRRLDFSHFSPVSLFSTASEREAARYLTAETLLRCLDLTPHLHEFLVQDYIDGDLSQDVLRKVFTGLPNLRAVDLCGSSCAAFRNAFVDITAQPAAWPASLPIQRLSLHKCITLPSSVFEFLLPKLDRLTHLDVAGTRITDAALHSIPATARITHLNLSKCSLLTADAVLDFLAHHPAVRHASGLVFLSLSFDAAISQLLLEDDVSRLLRLLPPSLKSLSLKGSKMTPAHIPQLRALGGHLEELAIGRGLTLGDINALVVPPTTQAGQTGQAASWTPLTLRYLDLTDIPVDSFDLSYFYLDSRLLDAATTPLEVLEVTEDVSKRISKNKGPLVRMGWRESEIGSRSWLVRGILHTTASGQSTTTGRFAMENGQRPWKMGAQSWGMRKLPVAHAKVGGMYGSYMFGRKL